MAMGIVVTAFTLFGMIALVVLNAALEEPREQRTIQSLPDANQAVSDSRLSKKAA